MEYQLIWIHSSGYEYFVDRFSRKEEAEAAADNYRERTGHEYRVRDVAELEEE